jgi:hypothetical protein
MIKETSHIEQKAVKITDSSEYYCDKCDKKIKVGIYDIVSNKIQFKHGSHFPGGGSYTSFESYLCDECANEIKIILEKLCIRFEKRDVDW